MRSRAAFGLAVAVLAAACAEPAAPPEQAGGRFVAFMSNATGDFEIYLLDPSNEDIQPLTAQAGFDGFPHFHPDGQSLLFTSERIGGDQEIYRMARDGTGVVRLTESDGPDQTPAYSPDASRITFVSERDEDPEIYIMNADGSGQTRVTDSPGFDFFPVFSPDGAFIYFVSERAGFRQILRTALDGSNVEVVFGEGEFVSRPTFDPTTGRLLFARSEPADPGQPVEFRLWQAEPDGSDAGRFAGAPLDGAEPTFSRDGEAIVFTRFEASGGSNLYVLDVATGQLDRITNTPASDRWPSFDPLSGG